MNRTFYLRLRWLSLSLLLLVAVTIAVEASASNWVRVLGLTLSAIAISESAVFTRIQVSERGIKYASMLSVIETSWDNIAGIGTTKFGLWDTRCILLHRNSERGMWTEPDWAIPKAERGRKIPLPEHGLGAFSGSEVLLELVRSRVPKTRASDNALVSNTVGD